MTATRFIVMEASAKVAGKARQFGRYIHVAVCEVEDGTTPAMISERAKGMVRIVWDSGAVAVGKTERSAAHRARAEAAAMCAEMNAR
jgi:hypothetical protein